MEMWFQLCHDLGELTGDVQIATIYIEEEFAILRTLQIYLELAEERSRTRVA